MVCCSLKNLFYVNLNMFQVLVNSEYQRFWNMLAITSQIRCQLYFHDSADLQEGFLIDFEFSSLHPAPSDKRTTKKILL